MDCMHVYKAATIMCVKIPVGQVRQEVELTEDDTGLPNAAT